MANKTPAHYPQAVQEVVRWLETSHTLQHLGWWERWSTVLRLWFFGFRRLEKEYMEAVKALGDDATREAAALVGKLVEAMHDEPQDLLGKIYQTIGANDKRFAQYFTPDSVAAAMAQMSLAGMQRSMFCKEGGASICEPCVGSGTMLIQSVLAVHASFGTWGTQRLTLVGIDLDVTCCRMAVLQLLWLSLRYPLGHVEVWCGDALRGTVKEHVGSFGCGVPRLLRRVRRLTR
jgi:hypothetical protein